MSRRPFASRQPLSILLVASLLLAFSAQGLAAPPPKPRIAIKEPVIGDGVRSSLKKYLNLSILLDEMEAAIQRNRKFQLLTRKQAVMEGLRDEQQFAGSSLSKGNAAAEGQMEAANYLIFPTVQDFKFYRSSKPVPNIDDKYVRRDSGMLMVNAQIIDTASGAVKATFALKSSFASGKSIVNSRGGMPSSSNYTRMAKAVAAEMTDQLVEFVFPMKVILVKGEQVWLNRGADGGLKVGQVLRVYRPGEELIDPDTGENLGSAEMDMGQVKVTQIKPKVTVAKRLKQATMGAVEKGDIVREK